MACTNIDEELCSLYETQLEAIQNQKEILTYLKNEKRLRKKKIEAIEKTLKEEEAVMKQKVERRCKK
jgi:uncharacterized protein involved in tolerance to divalent cations